MPGNVGRAGPSSSTHGLETADAGPFEIVHEDRPGPFDAVPVGRAPLPVQLHDREPQPVAIARQRQPVVELRRLLGRRDELEHPEVPFGPRRPRPAAEVLGVLLRPPHRARTDDRRDLGRPGHGVGEMTQCAAPVSNLRAP